MLHFSKNYADYKQAYTCICAHIHAFICRRAKSLCSATALREAWLFLSQMICATSYSYTIQHLPGLLAHQGLHRPVQHVHRHEHFQQGAARPPHALAPELMKILHLIQSGSLARKMHKSLCKLLKLAVPNSSLQTTIPFTCLPILEKIVHAKRGWQTEFTQEAHDRLNTFLGQPAVVRVLVSLKECQDGATVDDVLNFIGYLVRNVAFSLPLDAYHRVVARIPGAWNRMLAETQPGYVSNGSGSHVSFDRESAADRHQRMSEELMNGIAYHWHAISERGLYALYESLHNSTCEDNPTLRHSCLKDFPVSKYHTCELFSVPNWLCNSCCVKAKWIVTFVVAAGVFDSMCKHGVCYGLHIIPKSEGRNDAFTPLLTRIPMELLPLYFFYDFDCQLQE